MGSHNRHRSLGSLSILTHIRSLSRSGSRQDRVESPDIRSPSSMSCDPNRQPSPSPGPILRSISTTNGLTKSSTMGIPKVPSTNCDIHPPSYEKISVRPRSWLSVPRVIQGHITRSRSVQIRGKQNSRSGHNIISGPVLTGTTNAKVAEAEGIVCKDIVQPGPPFNEKVQPQVDKSTRLSDIVHSFRKKRPQSVDIPIENSRLPTVENGTARRKAETMNLYKEKINRLTGHGHIKRKSMNERVTLPTNDDPPLLSNSDSTFTGLESCSDFDPGSLTKSFASAVDKLDFQPSITIMPLSKSKSSIFSLGRREGRKTPEISHPIRQEKGTAIEPQPGSGFGQSDNEQITLSAAPIKSRVDRSYYPKITSSDPEQMRFDVDKNTYVRDEPFTGYPSGINPSRMHTNTMDFATAPAGIVLPKPQDTSHFGTIDEEDIIEDAPIYSPSSGDLAQYNRSTPSSATAVIEEDVEQETPTRPSGHKGYMQRLGLKKSKSGLGLFNKKKALSTKDENQKVIKKSRSMHFGLFKPKEDVPPVPESRFLPVTPSPLRAVTNTPELATDKSYLRIAPRQTTEEELIKRRGVVVVPVED